MCAFLGAVQSIKRRATGDRLNLSLQSRFHFSTPVLHELLPDLAKSFEAHFDQLRLSRSLKCARLTLQHYDIIIERSELSAQYIFPSQRRKHRPWDPAPGTYRSAHPSSRGCSIGLTASLGGTRRKGSCFSRHQPVPSSLPKQEFYDGQ
jgi:hypothetical protein